MYHDCWNADCPNLAAASCLGSISCCEKSPGVPGGKLAILVTRFLLSTGPKKGDPKSRIPTKRGKPGNLWKFKSYVFGRSHFSTKSGLVGEESWQCAQPLPLEDDDLTVCI